MSEFLSSINNLLASYAKKTAQEAKDTSTPLRAERQAANDANYMRGFTGGSVTRVSGALDSSGAQQRDTYQKILNAQAKQAEYDANNPNRYIDEYKQILNANRENDLAIMNQQNSNEIASQDRMYERMGALAKQQAESWLQNNKALAEQSFGYRSKESTQQYEQDKDIQLSTIRENEGVELRRRNSERSSALSAYKRL